MKTLKTTILAGALALGVCASAQDAPRTAYFLDGYSYRHELNPAFGSRNYISFPALANLDFGLSSNMGLDTFIYPTSKLDGYPSDRNYALTTFMSPYVDANEFLNKLSENSHLNFDYSQTILSTGFNAWGGFSTLNVGVRAHAGVNLPKDLFRFMKVGAGETGNAEYNFSDLRVQATAMSEIALGHSREIIKGLRVGAKVKFLVGLANIDAHMQDLHATFGDKEWKLRGKGELLMTAGTGLKVPLQDGEGNLIDWGGIKYEGFNIGGYGLGVDLGATYELTPDLTLSAAVQDLGAMSWKHAYIGGTGVYGGDEYNEWSFSGFQNVAVKNDEPGYEENKIETQLDNLTDGIKDIYNFHLKQNGGRYRQALDATLRLGAEYTLPVYRGISGGVLYTSYIGGVSSWNEGRFYANFKPAGWFNATFNYGISTFGNSFGWMLNFHPKGINFFIGSDHQFLKVTPQYIPLGHLNANINLGFNITFGSKS